MNLTPNQIRDYHTDGFTIVEGLISPRLLKGIAEHLDRAALGQLDSGIAVQVEPEVQRLDIRPENPLNRIRKVSRVVRHDSFFRSVATCEPILSCMQDILGDNLRFFGDEAQLKPAFYGSAHAWHQDAPYFYSIPLPVATVWIAVDEATPENGCLQVVPGLHRQGILKRPNSDQPWFDEGEFDSTDAVPVVLNAGDALFFHLCLPHGSGPNTSSNRRRSLIYRYINVDRITTDMIPLVNRHGCLSNAPDSHPIFRMAIP